MCRSHLRVQEAALHRVSQVCDCRAAGVQEGQEGFPVVKDVQVEKRQPRGALECVQHEQRLARVGVLGESREAQKGSGGFDVDGEEEKNKIQYIAEFAATTGYWTETIIVAQFAFNSWTYKHIQILFSVSTEPRSSSDCVQ